MAKKKSQGRRVYFSALRVHRICYHEPETDRQAIKADLFDRFVSEYEKAQASGDFTNFQHKLADDEVLMVSMLHYVGNDLCGIIGRCSPKVDRFLRERNLDTFGTKELTPSEGNLFEEYTYFAISTSRLQIAYLSNSAVSSNIPYLVIHILRQNSGNALYEMEPDTLIDTDIKKKLKSLGTKIKVQGTVVNQEQHIIGGMQSLRQLENTLSTKFSAKVKLTARVTKQLTDDDIDAITNLATLDDGFSSFSFFDEEDQDHEIIDVIKRQVCFSKKIPLSTEERHQPDVIWQKMCNSFN